jgi:tripartite-type tricarboxylate transporter receptor subunit TctC
MRELSSFLTTRLACAATALVAALALPGPGFAQTYPEKSVRMIVPFPPGGGTDIIARVLGQKLSESMGQAVVVENRAGAGGTLGSEFAAKSTPNGYTILMVSASYAVSPSLYKLGFDPRDDLVPVSLVASVPFVLVTYPGFSANSVAELVAQAKAKPGEINFASSGNGSAPHLAGEMLTMNTGTKMVHVPFKGGAPALTEVMGGRVQLLFSTVTQALPYIKGGKLKPLAVSSRARASALPQVPTLEESGVSGIDVGDWFGVLVPKGTPPDIVRRLSDEIRRAVASPDVKARLATEGFDPIGSSGEEFERVIRKDMDAYGRVVKAAGVKVD